MNHIIPKFKYPSRTRRLARVLAYLLWFIAGLILVSNPSQVVENELINTAVYVWSAFILLGGLSCFIGALTDIWFGEYAGLWLVITTLWLYGGLTLFQAPFSWPRVAIGLLLVSFGCKAAARWQDIHDLVRLSRKKAKSDGQNGDVA